MTLSVGQWQIRDLVMGTGTVYLVTRPGSTARPYPDLRSEDFEIDGRHGIDAGPDYLGGRRIPLKVQIRGGSRSAGLAALQTLQAAWAPSGTDIELSWCDDLGTFRYVGRPRLADPDENLISIGDAEVDCRFLATSPYYESATESTGSTGRTTPGAGVTPPFTPPFTLGASVSGTIRVSNDGTAAAGWTARLDGPLTDPVITNQTTGERLAFTGNGGLDIAAGEYVELSSEGRAALLAGTSSRRSQLSLDSRWWQFPPGATDLELAADAGTGTLTVTWRDAYI